MTAEDRKREQLKRENRVRDIQYLLKKNFPIDGDLLEWLKNTTGYDKPFPDDEKANWKAQGQRELVISIVNMVVKSPEEILKLFKEKGML